MDTLISNVTIVTMNEKMDVLFGAFLGIKDGKIAFVSKVAPKEQPATIIDGTGMVVMPGFVNCHTHLATTALRSYCDDLSLCLVSLTLHPMHLFPLAILLWILLL